MDLAEEIEIYLENRVLGSVFDGGIPATGFDGQGAQIGFENGHESHFRFGKAWSGSLGRWEIRVLERDEDGRRRRKMAFRDLENATTRVRNTHSFLITKTATTRFGTLPRKGDDIVDLSRPEGLDSRVLQ